MKWVTILSFVVVLSLTESRILQKRGHQEGHHEGEKSAEGHHHLTHTVAEAYKILGKDHFEEVALVVFSQLLPKCPYEEHVQRVKDVEDIAEKCSKGIKTAECGKSVATILVDEICKKPENEEKYPYHKECCAKEEHAREECFVSHKLTDPDALPPYVKRDPEEKCKEFKEHKDTFLGHYIYELARRKPQMYAPAILSFEHHYEEIASDCCKDPAHTAECFTEKMPAHKKQLKIAYAIQQHSCYIRKNFGERPLSALKLSQISQKMPKASFENIHEIVHGVVHLTESCCSGDMMECMADRLALSNKVCEKKDELSSKLKECCDKDVIERSECIVMLEPDEKPADLSPEVREFIDDAAVCQKYKDEKDQFLAKYRRFVYQTGDLQNRKWLNWMPDFDMSKDRFTYEYSRRHQELAPESILRVAAGYEGFLKKCCGGEDVVACLSHAEAAMKEGIKADTELLNTRCDSLEKVGTYHFENEILVRYTPKMPQVTTPSLIDMAEDMAHVGEKCCKLPAEKKFTCSELGLSLIIAKMCHKLEGHVVNDGVSHCCKDSYSAQRPCFTHLGPDTHYVPPAPSVDHFKFGDDLCTHADEHEFERKKQTFLVSLLKAKPDISTEQLQKIIPDFLAMVAQCCKADNHAECFTVEGPKLVHKCEETLGVHVHVEAPHV